MAGGVDTPEEGRAGSIIADFSNFYDCYFDSVNRYLRYRIGNAWDADDITAVVFIKAFEKYRQVGPPQSPAAWVFRIAHNAYVDYLRQRRPVSSLEEQIPADPDGGPEAKALLGEELAELNQHLGQLPEEHRDIIVLRYFADLKFAQIAEVLGKSESAVKTAGFRALRKLRALYDAVAQNERGWAR